MAKNVLGRYALFGASLFVGYDFIFDSLRHHDEANSRPVFFDHMIATTILGTALGAFTFSHPFHIFCAGFFSMSLVSPSIWWFKKAAVLNPVRPSNIFYENGCTPEEVERFRHQDEIEEMAQRMLATPGYGYHNLTDPRGL
jgi:hypothetical protein